MPGKQKGARETIARAPSPRSKGRCWLRICSSELARGKIESARAAGRRAVQELDNDGFEPFVAEDMALAASVASSAGEKEIGQKLFQRALGLSEANKSPKFHHSFIARFQVHGGLLADAHRTIQAIPKPSDRAQPLADLCKALAKAEYLEKK
jgi:hypothetical protein